jgi:hypothetical protein
MLKLGIGTASCWLDRLVRRFGLDREIRLAEITVGAKGLEVLIGGRTALLPGTNVIHVEGESNISSGRTTAVATAKIIAE